MSTRENVSAVAPIIIALLVFAIVVIFVPLITIWSLNKVFRLDLSYDFETWLAVLWIIAIWCGLRIKVHKTINVG